MTLGYREWSLSRRALVGGAVWAATLGLGACSPVGSEPLGGGDASGAPGSAGAQGGDSSWGADARVVALMRSIAELWLLAGGNLVGVTDDAFDLEGLSADATSVGTNGKPSLESIVALEPDVVMLSTTIPGQQGIEQPLCDAGIDVYEVEENGFEEYASIMADLTARTGRPDLYKSAVTDVQTDIDSIRERASSLPERSFLAIRVSAAKNKVLKANYFACEIFDDLQMRNVADDTSELDDLSLEAIAASDPYFVFVIPQGDEDEAKDAYESAFGEQPAWQELSAVQGRRVNFMSKDLFQYKPNARWAEAYEDVLTIRQSQG